jgi:hypothetical protein
MPKITTFDRPSIQTIRAEIQDAIRNIECRYGIKLTANRAKFSPKSGSITIDVFTMGADGEIIDHDREYLLDNLAWLGLKPEHVDAVVQIGSDTFKVNGYKRARRSKPFSVISTTNGRKYIASEDMVRSALGLPRRGGVSCLCLA